MLSYSDAIFAQLAVRNGLATEKELQRCLKILEQSQSVGYEETLKDVMVKMGILERETAHKLQRAQALTAFIRSERVYGRILIREEILTEEELETYEKEQKSKQYSVSLADLLIRDGVLDAEKNEELISEQAKELEKGTGKFIVDAVAFIENLSDEADELPTEGVTLRFGEVAIQDRLVTREQLDECLQLQSELKEKGVRQRLGEVLADRKYLTPAQVEQIVVALRQGRGESDEVDVFDDYEFELKIGQGRLGVVYKARNADGETVALKILPPSFVEEADDVEAFKEEAELAGELHHPNIVRAIDSGCLGGYHYYATEFVEGESLEEKIAREAPFDEDRIVRIGARIAEALDYARTKGLVHRNLTPRNIILTEEDIPKLCDLGSVPRSEVRGPVTTVNLKISVPYYSAPEVIEAEPDEEIDFRADIYSLGCILFEMATGEKPFKGEHSADVIRGHLEGSFPDVLELNPDLNPRMGDVIDVMCARNPEDRYVDYEELLQELQASREETLFLDRDALLARKQKEEGQKSDEGSGDAGEDEKEDRVPAEKKKTAEVSYVRKLGPGEETVKSFSDLEDEEETVPVDRGEILARAASVEKGLKEAETSGDREVIDPEASTSTGISGTENLLTIDDNDIELIPPEEEDEDFEKRLEERRKELAKASASKEMLDQTLPLPPNKRPAGGKEKEEDKKPEEAESSDESLEQTAPLPKERRPKPEEKEEEKEKEEEADDALDKTTPMPASKSDMDRTAPVPPPGKPSADKKESAAGESSPDEEDEEEFGFADPALEGRVVADRYEILSTLGAGGMGVVYQARHTLMDKLIAFKVLHRELLDSDESLSRFKREVRAAARFQHPNVVQIYDAGESDGHCYMAMEFIEGRELSSLIEEKGELSLEESIELMKQSLRAIAEAHDKGIVHRDLKTDNLMITTDDQGHPCVKVMDFGIAKILEENVNPNSDYKTKRTFRTKVGVVTGTPQYMSPEQAAGKEVDYRTDLYSVGIIFYEMLMGRLPFQSKSPVGFLGKHIVEAPPKFSQVRPDLQVPAGVEKIVMKALEKNKENRFQTAKEMLAAVEEIEAELTDEPETASADRKEQPEEVEDGQKSGRTSILSFVGILLLLALVAGGGYFLLQYQRRTQIEATVTQVRDLIKASRNARERDSLVRADAILTHAVEQYSDSSELDEVREELGAELLYRDFILDGRRLLRETPPDFDEARKKFEKARSVRRSGEVETLLTELDEQKKEWEAERKLETLMLDVDRDVAAERYEKALERLETALTIRSTPAVRGKLMEVALQAAGSAEEKGDLPRAIQFLERAKTVDPQKAILEQLEKLEKKLAAEQDARANEEAVGQAIEKVSALLEDEATTREEVKRLTARLESRFAGLDLTPEQRSRIEKAITRLEELGQKLRRWEQLRKQGRVVLETKEPTLPDLAIIARLQSFKQENPDLPPVERGEVDDLLAELRELERKVSESQSVTLESLRSQMMTILRTGQIQRALSFLDDEVEGAKSRGHEELAEKVAAIKAGVRQFQLLVRNQNLAYVPAREGGAVGAFWMGRAEVSNRDFGEFCRATDREEPKPEAGVEKWDLLPVRNLSHEDAVAFAEWLTREKSEHVASIELGFALPTEKEWMHAARFDGTDRPYPWGETLEPTRVVFDQPGVVPASETYVQNSLKLRHLIGNVAEFTSTPAGEGAWIVKGGSFQSEAGKELTIEARDVRPGTPHPDVGFRLILTVK